jgi:hypothetical protein
MLNLDREGKINKREYKIDFIVTELHLDNIINLTFKTSDGSNGGTLTKLLTLNFPVEVIEEEVAVV